MLKRKNGSATDRSKKKIYKKWWFWLIIIIIGIGAIGSEGEDAPENESASAEVQDEQSEPEKQKETTESAIQADAEIHKIVMASEGTAKVLTDSMSSVGSGINAFELYELAKQAQENHKGFHRSVTSLQNDNNKDYITQVQYYILNNKSVADDLIKYIDKNEMKYLSKAKERIEATPNHVMSVVSERMKYLSEQGLTSEEIQTILDGES